MRHRGRAGIVFVALLLSAGAQRVEAQETREVTLPAELDRVLRDYESAWQASDAARLASLFHPDGFVLSPGSAPVRGRAAIQAAYARAGGELHLRAVDYVADETVAYIVGLYRGATPGPEGKFVLALRRDRAGDPWLIGADMDNGNSR